MIKDLPGVFTILGGAVLALTAAMTTGGCANCCSTDGGDKGDARAFASPAAAVPAIDAMLRAEDWKGLAAYYDLAGSGIDRKDLESGKFFLRTERPADAHPGIPWKYRHPFPPGYRFVGAEPVAEFAVEMVTVAIEIDQGGGPKQRGLASFKMRKGPKGYRILPPHPAEEHGAAASPAPHKLAWTGYDGTGDPASAAYTLDGKPLGKGDAGLVALQKAIRAMPKGSVVLIVPYYGDPGGGPKKYPFDLPELKALAEGAGVDLAVPGAR